MVSPEPPANIQQRWNQIWDPNVPFSVPGRLTGRQISWRNWEWQDYSTRSLTSDDYLDIAAKTGVKVSCSGLKLTYEIIAGCCLTCPDLSTLTAFQ